MTIRLLRTANYSKLQWGRLPSDVTEHRTPAEFVMEFENKEAILCQSVPPMDCQHAVDINRLLERFAK